ncbi:hypothetical protein HOP60_01300 [Halomonas daqingensis]|uniref:Uncharacterized protein n=1 Tax=Billgrantia desiderata TaxID=52021 RepID=A0ABS9AZI4_9GAMM|nr:hypothetical protein [Halomonas desiderata]MCE8040788.1 hypothetical protein [Halomonas desiderata]MCE8045363.1 hypothetical protein [Halomonas desiderata]
MIEHHSTTEAPKPAELLHYLKGYVDRYQRQHGSRPAAVTLPRSTWLALGEPELAAGLRIKPRKEAMRLQGVIYEEGDIFSALATANDSMG